MSIDKNRTRKRTKKSRLNYSMNLIYLFIDFAKIEIRYFDVIQKEINLNNAIMLYKHTREVYMTEGYLRNLSQNIVSLLLTMFQCDFSFFFLFNGIRILTNLIHKPFHFSVQSYQKSSSNFSLDFQQIQRNGGNDNEFGFLFHPSLRTRTTRIAFKADCILLE